MKYFECFNGKTVIVTGDTGFKGSWLSIWLTMLGAKVVGISIGDVSSPSNYKVVELNKRIEHYDIDIKNEKRIREIVCKVQPDFVFHLAAQSLVRPSYENPLDTMLVNSIGSANILNSLRFLDKPVVAIMITSDKAYDNVEWVWGYRETDRLGGKDPYSASKGMAELAIRSYIESFFNFDNCNVKVGIARAGNVIGGGDWAIDRIVPDCMKAWANGDTIDIRSPLSTRPWQHVLEPLSGYLVLAQNLYVSSRNHSEAYNFGPSADQNYSVSNLIDEMSKYWSQVKWNDVSENESHVHEAGLLKLNCDKALHDLKWKPALKYEETVRMTVDWYKEFYLNKNHSMYDFTISQIKSYVKVAEMNNIPWVGND